MEDREPSLRLSIETLGGDLSQLVCRRFRAVFTVDFKQREGGWLVVRPGADGADARQHLRKRSAQDCQPSRTNSRYGARVVFVQSRLQLLKRVDVKRFVQALGQDRPDAWDGTENVIRFA
jgi:hypothetical protein